MMDFFLDDVPHDGFNKGKEIAKQKSQAKPLDSEDSIEKIFTKINSHLTPEVAKGTNACFLFVVKGNYFQVLFFMCSTYHFLSYLLCKFH